MIFLKFKINTRMIFIVINNFVLNFVIELVTKFLISITPLRAQISAASLGIEASISIVDGMPALEIVKRNKVAFRFG